MKKKYSVNENYFENIDSEDKAYWLGFLFADGSIRDPKNKLILGLCLSTVDLDHLKKFKIFIKSDNKIEYYKDKRGYETSQIRISNKKLCLDLIKLGCVPRKTFNLPFPKIREDLVRHFIRGYFDGDGSVFKIKNRPNLLGCKFLGQENFLLSINQILNSINIFRPICKSVGVNYIMMKSKPNIKSLYEYMYKDSTIYLDRKYNKFKEWIDASYL